MPYVGKDTGFQSLSPRSSFCYNGGRETIEYGSQKAQLSMILGGENHRNATEYKFPMTMDPRFPSSTHPGQSFYPNIPGYRKRSSGSQKHGQQRRPSASSIAIDENLSRLFECMRLEYGTWVQRNKTNC